MAYETGMPLIPVISYGENEIYDVARGEYLDKIYDFFIKYNIPFVLPTMESLFRFYNLLNTPFRKTIQTVIGDPIPVAKKIPTNEEIIELRTKYFASLNELYEKTRPPHYAEKLIIV